MLKATMWARCSLGLLRNSWVARDKRRLTIQGVRAKLTALINDTTGTLIASNYVDPSTRIAVIFGTGCNAAYMETAEYIPKLTDIGLPKEQNMAINVSY